ncbi:MAG: hypothetical protein RSE14_10105 [Erythrobacter sp.]|uniref:hypothetical protein n=1 Tax=Erythrobacter sp. TaxID=1042 RepID=UPI002B46F10E|nr:hypothetical protein [Erythrobacter sp.]WRH69635.1 MAG: hypothetical protein RSE14_10105 [Erythrobacter sp.]
MTEQLTVTAAVAEPMPIEPFDWLGRVLANFATAERAIGQLCLALELPVEKGPLSNLQNLCHRLERNSNKRCQTLLKRIERWRSLRPLRHLLAHASIMVVRDSAGNRFILTRHLPLDRYDVTPDKLWTEAECRELLRVASNDGRSISDQIRNLLLDSVAMAELKKPDPGSPACAGAGKSGVT